MMFLGDSTVMFRSSSIAVSLVVATIGIAAREGTRSAWAQDAAGNYYPDKLPAQGEYVINTWRVVNPSGLRCRSGAGNEFRAVKLFARGEAFTVRTFSGKVQHNNPTRLDRQGLPWFYLTEASGNCFVRAHRRYLAPVPEQGMNQFSM